MREENMIAMMLIIFGLMLFLVGLLVDVWYVPVLATALIFCGIIIVLFMGYAHAPERKKSLFGRKPSTKKSVPPRGIKKPSGGKQSMNPFTRKSK